MRDDEHLAASAVDPGALPVSPELQLAMDAQAGLSVRAPRDYEPVDRRTIILSALAVALAVAAALAAQLLTRLIGLVKRLSGDERNQARVRLLELFDTLGNTDERVLKARRDLMTALF